MPFSKPALLSTIFMLIVTNCGGSAEPTLLPPKEPDPARAGTPTLADPRAPSGEPSDVLVAQLGQPFKLSIGQSAVIEDLAITFTAVSEDSRCPEGAQCIWAGQVKVVVRVQKDGEALGEFEMTVGTLTDGDVAAVEVAGYVLSLLGVEPYPKVGEEIGEGEYVLEMVVE